MERHEAILASLSTGMGYSLLAHVKELGYNLGPKATAELEPFLAAAPQV